MNQRLALQRILAPCLGVGLLLASGASLAASGPLLSQSTLSGTPLIQLAAPILPQAPDAPSRSYDYATGIPADFTLQEQGKWENRGELSVWRLQLQSDDALSLSVRLESISLPNNSELRLYDGAGLLWHGPYTPEQLQRHDEFWSPIVRGDTILLELRVPSSEQAAAQLQVTELQHGYADMQRRAKSGDCNVDVACPAADGWTDAVRASARITIGGRRVCSAVLLNNTSENGDPLLLTAQHCGIGQSEQLSAKSVVVYWNYETSRCGGNPDGSLRQNQTGSTLLAQGPQADFSLIRLDDLPRASFNVHYAGWNASRNTPTSGVSVHHPGGDEKRISTFNQSARAVQARVDDKPVDSWEIRWSEGVTEAGSSGSGLWNEQHQIVGHLSGGNSSCSSPNSPDVFGRLNVAWEESPESSGQLRAWLDPSNSGSIQLDGQNLQSLSLRAQNDEFLDIPADSELIRLDVLRNDIGQYPLRLLNASTEQGDLSVLGEQLGFQFAPGQTNATLRYEVMDRWGEVSSAEVRLQREDAKSALTTRGGSLSLWLLILMLTGARAWRYK